MIRTWKRRLQEVLCPARDRQFPQSFLEATVTGMRFPQLWPAGAARVDSDGTITRSAEHGESKHHKPEHREPEHPADSPIPVILIHGTWMNAVNSWSYLAPRLADTGRDVYTFTYGKDTSSLAGLIRGVCGNGDLEDSYQQVCAAIETVMAHTGANYVDLVAHSQGAMHARRIAHQFNDQTNSGSGSSQHVRRLVSITGNHQGTTATGLGTFVAVCRKVKLPIDVIAHRLLGAGAIGQLTDGPYFQNLNMCAGSFALSRPEIDYLNIATSGDYIVTPWDSALMPETTGHKIKNIKLPENYPGVAVSHLSVLFHQEVSRIVVSFLSED